MSLFPEMFAAVGDYGITGRAVKQGRLRLCFQNPRDYALDRHRSVDDRPYGGGPGMLMMVQPLRTAIRAARAEAPERSPVVYLSPQGQRLDQKGLDQLAASPGLILVAGRYEGVDERVIETDIDQEWSIGDYVLSGGELAAMVIIDGIARLLPGVLGHPNSAGQDSFVDGLLDCPHYTRPETVDGLRVPEVLLQGNHQAIRRWRLKQALGRTWLRRPDLLQGRELNREQRQLLDEFVHETAATGATTNGDRDHRPVDGQPE